MNKRLITPLVLTALPLSLMAQSVITWNGEGDGSSYTNGANWGGTAPADDLTSDIAQLTGGTVTLDTTRQVYGLDFNSGTTLSGDGSIEIGSGGIEVNANSYLTTTGIVLNQAGTTVTLDGGRLSFGSGSTVSGIGGLTVTGNNTLYMDNYSSGNTYSGGTTITGGASVSVKHGDAFGTGGIILDNGTLRRNNASFAVANDITVNSGGGTINTDGNLSGLISGTGALTIVGQGNEKTIASGNTLTGNVTLDNTYFRTSGGDSYGTGDITMKNGATIKNNDNSITLANDIVVDATGGALEAGWSKRQTLSGTISGDGALTIKDDSGTWSITSDNTYSGGTEIQGIVWAKSGALGTGDVTLNNVNGSRGHLQNNSGATTLDNNIIIDDTNGGRMQAGWSNNLNINGVVSGSGELTIVGDSGTVVLGNAANTYSGNINLQDSTSRLSLESLGSGATISGDASATLTLTGDIVFGADSTWAGTTTVSSGGSIGGGGSVDGNLTISAGGMLVFSATDTFNVAGDVTLDSTFGIDDLVGISSSTEVGTYTLIGETTTDFSHIENFGEAAAYDLGDGKSAYFSNGSLQVTVIPEPATLGMVALFGGSVLFIRRRFMM